MAGPNQESYWRIYLLLQEGSPLIFKQLVAREIEKCGGNIDALLLDIGAKLCEDLCTSDIDILFPESQKTDIDKWNTGIFPCVILTLFSKTLPQLEKQLIKRIQNVQEDIEGLPDMSLDNDAYDDLEQTLSKTLHKLACLVSNEMEMVTKIDKLLQMFLQQPLNVMDLLGKIRIFNMPNKTRQKLREFLEAQAKKENTSEVTSDTQTSVKEEVGSLDKYGSSRKSANVSETQIDLDESGKLEEATRGSDEICSNRQDITRKENAIRTKGSDEICSNRQDITRKENTIRTKGSDEICSNRQDISRKENTIRTKGSDEICSYRQDITRKENTIRTKVGGHTEQQRESTRLLWQPNDFGKNISVKRVDDAASNKIEDWENMFVEVAVIGRTGVGKSRFINVIRGCTSKTDPLYVEVGSIETTSKVGCYPHPKNKKLLFYDLPGIGTANFKREKFLNDKRINFYSYDMYIIMASDRFTTDESFFAESLKRSGKTFLFVRSRVDINLEDADDEKAEIDKIRNNCEKNLRALSFKGTDVFLISSKQHNHRLLDFDRLVERLVYSLSGLKKEAMMFSLQFNTTKIKNDKEKALQNRMRFSCIISDFVGGIAARGVSQAYDYAMIVREVDFYRQTLGITDNNLKDLAEIANTNVDELKRQYGLISFHMSNKIFDEFGNIVEVADIFKSHILSDFSKCTSKSDNILKSNLNRFVNDARKMMHILVKETGMKISRVQ